MRYFVIHHAVAFARLLFTAVQYLCPAETLCNNASYGKYTLLPPERLIYPIPVINILPLKFNITSNI